MINNDMLLYTYSLIASALIILLYKRIRKAIVAAREYAYDCAEQDIIQSGVRVFSVCIKEKGGAIEECHVCHNTKFFNPVKYNTNIVVCTRCRAQYEVSTEEEEF